MKNRLLSLVLAAATTLCLSAPALAAPAKASGGKPNILFIMGDDIGWMQPSIYHQGPVSYTHLDVYKRQRSHPVNARSSIASSPAG